MSRAERKFKVDRTLAKSLRDTPFDYSLLGDRDGFGLIPVRTDGVPETWLARPNAPVKIWREGDRVTRVHILDGKKGMEAWIEHGLRLPDGERATIKTAFSGADRFEDAVARATQGPLKRALQIHREERDEGCLHTAHLLYDRPRRAVALEALVDGTGRVLRYDILEGRDAWKAFAVFRE